MFLQRRTKDMNVEMCGVSPELSEAATEKILSKTICLAQGNYLSEP